MTDRRKILSALHVVPYKPSPIEIDLARAQAAAEAAAPDGQAASYYNDAEFLMGRGGKWRPTEKVYFRIDEAYIAEARRWIESGGYGGHYDSMSDLIVHAVVRHLLYTLPSWKGELEGSSLHMLHQINEVCSREEMDLRHMKTIDRIGASVADTLELPGGAREVGRIFLRKRPMTRSLGALSAKTRLGSRAAERICTLMSKIVP